MFLYGIGIQYGKQFFAGLSGPGLKWNLLAAVGVLGSLAVALALGGAAGVSPAYSMGLFAGSLTSTPTLQAAIDAAGNRDPAIGYSVAYPFGVIGPILCLFAFSRLVRPRLAPAPAPLQPLEITLARHARRHRRRSDGQAAARRGARRRPPGRREQAARPAGPPRGRRRRIVVRAARCARKGPARARPRRSRPYSRRTGALWTSCGCSCRGRRSSAHRSGSARFPDGIVAKIAEVRRGDAVLFPAPDLVLEYGDRVAVIAPREAIPRLRKYFGDSLKSTAEFSYVSVGLGMSLGVLLGLVADPDPGHGRLLARSRGRPASRLAHPRQTRKDRLAVLAHPASGEPHASQLRADAVPRRSGPRGGRALRGHCRPGRASRSSESARRSCSEPS